MLYVVNKEKLLLEIEASKRVNPMGIINWFISPDGILHVILDHSNIKFLYMVPRAEATQDIVPCLGGSKAILGAVDDDEIYSKMSKTAEHIAKAVESSPEQKSVEIEGAITQ